MSLNYKAQQLHRLTQTATWGAIKSPRIGLTLKGSWRPQNHTATIVWLSPHSNWRATQFKTGCIYSINDESRKGGMVGCSSKKMQSFWNPLTLGEKDKALERHLRKLELLFFFFCMIRDQAKFFKHILSFPAE